MEKNIVFNIDNILKKIKDNEEFAVGIRLTGSKTIQWIDFTKGLSPQWDVPFILDIGKIKRTDPLKIILYKKPKCGCKNRICTNTIQFEDFTPSNGTIDRILLKVSFGDINSQIINAYPRRQIVKTAFLSSRNKLSQQSPSSIREISGSSYLQKAKKFFIKIFKILSGPISYNDFSKSQFNDTLCKFPLFYVDRAQSQYRYTRLGIYHTPVKVSNVYIEPSQDARMLEVELAISKNEKVQLRQEKVSSEKEPVECLRDIDELKSQLKEKDIKIGEMNEKMKRYELEIINCKKQNGDLPSTDIEIGAYEYGGINPAVIAEHWNAMYLDLYRTIVRTIKSIESHSHNEALDSNEHWKMIYQNSKKNIIQPRFQAFVIVRKASELLRIMSRAVIINEDGSLAEDNKEDFLQNLIIGAQIQIRSRQEIAKILLDKLVNPNDLADKATYSFFDKLSDPLKEYLDKIFKINLRRLKKVVNDYSIGNNDVYNSLEIFLYTAIYIAIEISAISDNSIMAYWSSCYWDKELFKLQINNHSLQIPQMESFYNEVERIPLLEDQNPFVLFSVFPGCAYFDRSGNIDVISPCKVIYAGSD